ncbi:MAG TPA: hypothetical protein VFB82_12645 [Blastocatellia bacterium]|jgi:hypothetical protein|nr:hypothetical protein [Blastocatellia bacterium]
MKHRLATFALVVIAMMSISVRQPTNAFAFPQHGQETGTDAQHHAEVNKRGDQAMGFSHEKTSHHFLLKPNGGVIVVTANDPNDGASRDQIRRHLTHVAEMFSKGDFSLPMFTHGEAPPGTDEMTRLKADIKYSFESIDRGGRVLIATDKAEAIQAVHQFLRFQIKDHKTGDPLDVGK